MKKVYIVGIGAGNQCYIHSRAKAAIEESACLVGAKRMLEGFAYLNKEMFESICIQNINDFIIKNNHDVFCVLVSGDTGFYSMSKKITEILSSNKEIMVENIPAVSSMQYMCSRLNISWDDVKHVSVHGRKINIVSIVMFHKKTFILTGGEYMPDDICKILSSKGLGHLKVSVGENLSYSNERIIEDTASNIAQMCFESLAAVIVHNQDAVDLSAGLRSIRDDEFITGSTPMTKSEVRTVSIGKLNIKNDSTVYDVGAGTGSVSIETALKLTRGTLYAIEKNDEAINLIKKNKEKFKAYNIDVIKAEAPGCFEYLPKPDCAFIGGSGGNLEEIIEAVLKKNSYANIVVNAITLENLNKAVLCMDKFKFENVEIINASISKCRRAGSCHMMMGQNPIYIISGKGSGFY